MRMNLGLQEDVRAADANLRAFLYVWYEERRLHPVPKQGVARKTKGLGMEL